MFGLQNHKSKLENANPRAELHGDEHKLAVDLKLSTDVSNGMLAVFDPALKSALYWKGDGSQGELLDDPGHLPALRFPEMGPIRWSKDLAGYTLTVHVGVSGSSNIVLADCAVDKFVFEPKEGGSVGISFRIQAHPDPVTLGRLCELIQQDIELTLTPPEANVKTHDDGQKQTEPEEVTA